MLSFRAVTIPPTLQIVFVCFCVSFELQNIAQVISKVYYHKTIFLVVLLPPMLHTVFVCFCVSFELQNIAKIIRKLPQNNTLVSSRIPSTKAPDYLCVFLCILWVTEYCSNHQYFQKSILSFELQSIAQIISKVNYHNTILLFRDVIAPPKLQIAFVWLCCLCVTMLPLCDYVAFVWLCCLWVFLFFIYVV